MSSKLTEQQLIDLGFQKNIVPIKDSGLEQDYYYYSYRINDDNTIITMSNDEIIDDDWSLLDVNISSLKSLNFQLLQSLIQVIK